MKALFEDYVTTSVPNGNDILQQIDWNKWLFGIGMPDKGTINFDVKEVKDILKLVECYKTKNVCDKTVYPRFMLDQKIIFVQKIRGALKNFKSERIHKIEEELEISKNEKNPEVLAVWLELMILSKNPDPVQSKARQFLEKHGRMKYIIPIYAAYSRIARDYGKQLFNDLKHLYHPIAVEQIERLFK
eukprot:TRINITY_DN3724_c0_g1_i1.p2 TRINITY_DN3724_c0_g1~~TRINITY_DN3724_c0_g1_i1.p2  ORF type:complete len:187 (-),score=37.89 TRINITY_DN3724_c0_g1_i1:178-738(-)